MSLEDAVTILYQRKLMHRSFVARSCYMMEYYTNLQGIHTGHKESNMTFKFRQYLPNLDVRFTITEQYH